MHAQNLIAQLFDQYSEWEEVVGDKYPYLIMNVLANQLIQERDKSEQQRAINKRMTGLLIKEGVNATGL